MNHTKGEPIFGNGGGAISWNSMQTELSKAALKKMLMKLIENFICCKRCV